MLFYAPEELKYKTDFYDYLESQENKTRYTVPISFLKENLGDKFSILDVNPLKGALIPHLSKECDYVGLDVSEEAVKYCTDKYPERFFTTDLDLVCNEENKNRFDVISFSNGYIVRRFRDKDSTQDDTEYVISKLLNSQILKKDGFLALNPHFFYRDNPDYSFFKQAEFWLSEIEKKTQFLNPKEIVFSAISRQLGIENVIRQSKQKPDWFLDDPHDNLDNKHAGTYIASAHIIYQPVLESESKSYESTNTNKE